MENEARKQIGYASHSRRERQSALEPQRVELGWAGCQAIFDERVEGSDYKRIVLARLLDRIEQGDILTITKLDRLARSPQEAMRVVQALAAKGATLRIININLDLDSATPTGRSMLQLLGAVAELERTAKLDKEHEGRAAEKLKARLQAEARNLTRQIGEYELALAHLPSVRAMLATAKDTRDIARDLGIPTAIVYHAKEELACLEDGEPHLENSLAQARDRLAALTKSLAAK